MHDKVIFMGTPEFALPSLHAVANLIPRDLLLVVTQPDRPAGRGRRMQSPPVRDCASELGLEVLQVDTLRDDAVKQRIRDFAPDLIVVAAFGLLLPKWVLELPRRGCVNLHASLLPRFRGASPIPAAIYCGDSHSGVTLMQMERGLDTGPVFAAHEELIRHKDTTQSLTGRLADTAATLVERHLSALLAGDIVARPQEGTVIETRKILKSHGAIDWYQPVGKVEQHVRAMWPWPRAWTETEDGIRLQVHEASILELDPPGSAQPGTIRHTGTAMGVATTDGWLKLDRVQLAGKTAQRSGDLLKHPSLEEGRRLGVGGGFELPEPWIIRAGETGKHQDR